MRSRTVVLAGLALAMAAASPLAAGLKAGTRGRIDGEVVAVRQQTDLQNRQDYTEVRVRTRDRQEHWLRLGPAAEYGDAFRSGDRMRCRVIGAGEDRPALVRTARNERTQERMRIRDADGTMLRAEDRIRDRSRAQDRDRQRDRIHEPGTGGGSGSGSRRGGRRGGR
jgi:hypothetical protein